MATAPTRTPRQTKDDHHRSKAYAVFRLGLGKELDELVLPVEEALRAGESSWLWLVNLNQGGVLLAPEPVLAGVAGVVDVVEWLGKPYVLVEFGTPVQATNAHTHLLAATTLPVSRGKLYVDFARPQVVPSLLASLAALGAPEPVITVDGRKEWGNGLVMLEEFVTVEEERLIMEGILGEEGWHSDLTKRQSRHAGPVFDYTTFASSTSNFKPIPPYLAPLLSRLPRLEREPVPDQLTIQYYPPGTGIPPHVDTHSAFGESLYSLSLNSAVDMSFTQCGPTQARRLRLPKRSLLSSSAPSSPSPSPSRSSSPLPPPDDPPQPTRTHRLPARSLAILTGASRYGWTHGIAPRRADQVGKRVVPRAEGGRYSVTFRTVRRGVECECGWGEFCDSRIRREGEWVEA